MRQTDRMTLTQRLTTLLLTLSFLTLAVTPAYALSPTPPPPNDPLWSDQWALSDSPGVGLNIREAWRYGRGEGVVVAVVDTGIIRHPEFRGRILPGYDFISSSRSAGDGDGRDSDPTDPGDWLSEELIRQDGFDESCEVSDSSWHGTHVAGIIGAAAGNRVGVVGVAPLVRILPVRAIGRCGGTERDLADAIRWSAGIEVSGVPLNTTPADIINLSLGAEAPCSDRMQGVVDEVSARGVMIVSAVGNENTDAGTFTPANCLGTLTVSAITSGGQRASYSNYGLFVDLAAPGGETDAGILSTIDRGKNAAAGPEYTRLAGTSMAAPHVAGVLAIARGLDPLIPREELFALLLANLSPFAPDTTTYGCSIEGLCGVGRIDPPRLLAAMEARPVPEPTVSAPAELQVGAEGLVSGVFNEVPLGFSVTTSSTCQLTDGGRITALARGGCTLRYEIGSTALHKARAATLTIPIKGLTPALNVSTAASVRRGKSTSVAVESLGEGKRSWKSLTPATCAVSQKGVVRGLKVGKCSIRLRIAGTAVYEPASAVTQISIRR